MHCISIYSALLVAIATLSMAELRLYVDAGVNYEVGQEYPVQWTSDKDRVVNLQLYSMSKNYGAQLVQTIFTGRNTSAGYDTYLWVVPAAERIDSRSTYQFDLRDENPEEEADVSARFSILGGAIDDGYAFTPAVICGVVFGTLAVFLGVVGGLAYFFIRRRRAKKASQMAMSSAPQMTASEPPPYTGTRAQSRAATSPSPHASRRSEDSLVSEKERVRATDLKGMDV